MMNTLQWAMVVQSFNPYTKNPGVEHTYGNNIKQSPQAPPPLPSSIPKPYTSLPAVGGGLKLSGGAYGR